MLVETDRTLGVQRKSRHDRVDFLPRSGIKWSGMREPILSLNGGRVFVACHPGMVGSVPVRRLMHEDFIYLRAGATSLMCGSEVVGVDPESNDASIIDSIVVSPSVNRQGRWWGYPR